MSDNAIQAASGADALKPHNPEKRQNPDTNNIYTQSPHL